MTSAKTFRRAAAAALMNANELCAEAELLAENGHKSRAAALAVIGLEEFAKAVACTVAAIFPEQSKDLWNRLNDHNVKQWIIQTFDGVESEVENGIDGISWGSGVHCAPEADAILLEIFRTLSKSDWGSFIPTKKAAKSAAKKDQETLNDPKIHALPTDYITTAFIKNAALYVDLSEKGEVLSPNRIDGNTQAEIGGLAWSLRRSDSLIGIFSNEEKWKWFAKHIRQTPGAHLSIGKDVLTPQKRALRIIKKLPETATWNQIQKKIEAAVKADDEHREIN
jgi:AbiV family abortive infection protein